MSSRLPRCLPVLLAFCLPALGAVRFQGYAERGGSVVVTSAVNSTTKVQQSFPGATVTVRNSFDNSTATIYSNATGTAQANPFTADATGFWTFYASDGLSDASCGATYCGTYSVTFSGLGINSPYTWSGVTSFDPKDFSFSVSDLTYLETGRTFYQACLAAVASGFSLIVSGTWTGVAAGTCAANLVFVSGGSVRPSNAATIALTGSIAAPAVKICDVSAGGNCTIRSNLTAFPQWWGALGDDSTDNATALNDMAASAYSIYVPPGTYRSSTALTLGLVGQKLICDSPQTTIFKFTAATQGIDMYAGSGTMFGNEVSNCQITTTHASGNSALIVDSDAHASSGIVLRNNFITTTPPNGGGAWINGFRFLGNQGAIAEGNRVYGSITNGWVLGDGTTAVTNIKLIGNLTGAISITGTMMALTNAQSIVDYGGYYQGGSTANITANVTSDLVLNGTVFDSGGNTTTDGLTSTGVLKIDSLTMNGSGYVRGITASNGRASIARVVANGSFSSYVVGLRTASPGSVMRDSYIINSHATGVGVEVDFGTASALTGSYISTVGGAVVNLAGGGTNLDFSGNQLVSSTGYGILLPADGSSYSFLDNDTRYNVSDRAHLCGNCDGGSGAAIVPPNAGSKGRSLNGVSIPDTIYVGTAVTSASTIIPSSSFFHVTGTTSTSVMTPPYAGYAGCVRIVADAAWPWATGGGAGGFNTAGTATAGHGYEFCYDGNFAKRLWYLIGHTP